jgi:Fe-S-cluster containining protein
MLHRNSDATVKKRHQTPRRKRLQSEAVCALYKQGYATLKNRNGYCVFYDLTNRRCSEYLYRPSGCRVYPVIVDEDVGVVLDTICESRGSISDQEKAVKGRRVVKLLETIDAEAADRRV